jgi:hypothetical protein
LAVAMVTVMVVPFALAEGEKSPRRVARIDEAKRIAGLVTDLKATLETQGKLDIEARRRFDDIIAATQKIARPISSEDLTEEEREILAAQLSRPKSEDSDDWYARLKARLLEQAFEETELTDEEREAATKVISSWYDASNRARAEGDSKQVGELKRVRDDDLRELLGRRKGAKVLNNLNRVSAPGWGR